MTTLRFRARPAMIGVAAVLLAVLVAAGCGSQFGSSCSPGSGGSAGSSTTMVGSRQHTCRATHVPVATRL